jgi:hypothetical protein
VISQELYIKIQKANQDLISWNLRMLNIGAFFTVIVIVLNIGFNFWLLVLRLVVVITNLQAKNSIMSLKVLIERTSGIEYIEVERAKGQVELDIKLFNSFNEYEIKLLIKQANEIIKELKAELPKVEFREEKYFTF